MHFSRRDLFFSVVTGLVTGISAWRIFVFLNVPEFYGVPWGLLVVIVPVLWILGVNLGYFLGRWMAFFNQFGRFAAVGFTNAAVDFGVLNLLISFTGESEGSYYSVFKTASFLLALFHSYIWNKFWVFESGESRGGGTEFGKFLTVYVLTLLLNVGVASAVVHFHPDIANIDAKRWANLGAVVAAAIGLMFNFVGLRMLVFKKNQ